MSSYRLKITYDTGDSFSHKSDVVDVLSYQYNSLELAKENMKRIAAHHRWISETTGYARFDFEEEEILKKLTWGETQPWFVKKEKGDVGHPSDVYEHYVLLVDNDGKSFREHAFWHGYFETLKSVEIIADPDEMKIEF